MSKKTYVDVPHIIWLPPLRNIICKCWVIPCPSLMSKRLNDFPTLFFRENHSNITFGWKRYRCINQRCRNEILYQVCITKAVTPNLYNCIPFTFYNIFRRILKMLHIPIKLWKLCSSMRGPTESVFCLSIFWMLILWPIIFCGFIPSRFDYI